MNRFLCWLFGHRWQEVKRRMTMDLDHVEYRCLRCDAEVGGADGLVQVPNRPDSPF